MAVSEARGPLSMTGYGRASKRTSVGDVTVELRSTNHRYLELDARLPNGLTLLQGRLTELVRRQIRRGRVEAQIAVQFGRRDSRQVTFDEALLKRYHHALVTLQRRFGLKGDVTLDHLLALPQALTIAEERTPAEELWEPIRQTAERAVRELVRSRRREGGKLVKDLRAQLTEIERHLRAVKKRLPKAFEEQKRRLRERLQELLGPGSAGTPGQLEQAAALAKDADVNEELVRLESHLTHVRQSLAGRALVGKRLDFIAQELMREANTMGAKVNDAEAAQHVVSIKGCIEKIREQVQNLE
jgi:uncharacterized protein (TIGR00255 family)